MDLSLPKELQNLVNKWRKRLSIDPIYIIQIIETVENTGHPARIDGLELDNPHPTVNIIIDSEWLQKNKNNEKAVTEIIIHELVHIILYDAFIMIDPNYKYEGPKARANEVLTMKVTKAIITSYYDK